jgi:hypothetical protein
MRQANASRSWAEMKNFSGLWEVRRYPKWVLARIVER